MSILNDDQLHRGLGTLDLIEGNAAELVRLLRQQASPVRRWKRLTWAAGQWDRYEDGESFKGALIYNDGASDAYLALSSADLTATGRVVTVYAGSWVALPLETSLIFAGGPSAGSLLVFALEVSPAPAVGAVKAAAYDTLGNLKVSLWSGSALATFDAPNDGQSAGTSVDTTSRTTVFTGAGWDRARVPAVFKDVAAVAVTAATPATIWTPTAGKKFRLMGWSLSLSVAGQIIFVDQAANIVRTGALAAGIGRENPPTLGNGYLSALANNVLKIDVSASGTVNGFVFGTEE